VALTSTAPPNIVQSGSDVDGSIIGGERDIRVTVEVGASGLVFVAGATGGVFSVSTPNQGSGQVLLQYDGIDGSPNLSLNPGLNIDLTSGGALGFRIEATVDVDTEFTITAYDYNGGSAFVTSEVPGGLALQSYFIPFDSEAAGIDFTRIAAVEFNIQAFQNVDFNLNTFVTFGPPGTTVCPTGEILPCDFDYYRIEELGEVVPGDYVVIEFTQDSQTAATGAHLYVRESVYTDLETDLLNNNGGLLDTLENLPGPNNYTYYCEGDCTIEIVWSSLANLTYYLAVEGYGYDYSNYTICLYRRNVPVVELFDGVSNITLNDQRPTIPPDDRVLHYAYYFISVPEDSFIEGSYLTVNISRVVPLPGTYVRIMYESLPETREDTGVLDKEDDSVPEGEAVDLEIYPYCVDRNFDDAAPYFRHPAKFEPIIPCECFSDVVFFNDDQTNYQLTCSLTVDPCHFKYGNWYISVELYPRSRPDSPGDQTGLISYTLTADIITRNILRIFPDIPYPDQVFSDETQHYRLEVPREEVIPGAVHMVVHINNVRNGWVDLWVHQGLLHTNSLAGGPEGCAGAPSNGTCHTSDGCFVVIEKCHFDFGFWYIAVSTGFDRDLERFEIYDRERGPIEYVLQVDYLQDPVPQVINSGVAVFGSIDQRLYNFYVLHVPQTVDTWLNVELFVRGNDTEVIVAALHGALPGGDCYARPDFYCETGDPRGARWSSGPYSFNDNAPIQRESCSFMIQPCHLQPGPLFLSVYGAYKHYEYYGDDTYYDQPVSYTLWVDFDVPLALVSGRALTEVVHEKEYQHYYIRADQVPEGSWLSVEITNIRHGIGQSVEAYINFNQLAGDCPCYDSILSCTNSNECPTVKANVDQQPLQRIDLLSVFDCCTLIVPASDFKSGVWYIGVQGISEDYTEWSTPIGYTLTATIHAPPVFNALILGQPWNGELPQWNRTLAYSHFSLHASPVPENQLVFKMTWVQNCEFLGKHDDTFDVARMFVNLHTPAGHGRNSHKYACETSTEQDSYCTITIPECKWEQGTYFVAVQGDYDGDFQGRFTLEAYLEASRDFRLSDGVARIDSVGESQYNHYFIETQAHNDRFLWIHVYPNYDQDEIHVFLNKDARAGAEPCYTQTDSCTSKVSCSWQILACELTPGRYYISVQGAEKQFYAIPTEYTVVAALKPVVIPLLDQMPYTGHLRNQGDLQHYSFHVGQVFEGGFLVINLDNVKGGEASLYVQYETLAGSCPCFTYSDRCNTGFDNYCTLVVPSCELQQGTYFYSVQADFLYQQGGDLVFDTPLGYTTEITYVQPVIKTLENDLSKQVEDLLVDEFVGDQRYRHYHFYYDDDDYSSGNHVIVEITEVREGSLRVFYNYDSPGSTADGCHLAELCNGGIPSGSECYWQIPYCILQPSDVNNHYISIFGETARKDHVLFNILVWRQVVPTLTPNPSFTLDNVFSSFEFPANVELNVTHPKTNEPVGWAKFIRLANVIPNTDPNNGELLELFFYRVTGPVNEDISFNVYVHPNKPAGAHGCCDRDDPVNYGSCLEAPCLNSADTTTKVGRGAEVFTHTCILGNGLGFDNVGNPFYGETCTVRVWPCEFTKYCDEVTDWYVSVVPITPIDIDAEGVGLSYSFQWRQRDIRLATAGDVGSVNLTRAINTFEFTGAFAVPYLSSESEGWLSFFINVGLFEWNNPRISIQTKFEIGSGTVYIRGGDFASHSPSCHDYECTANGIYDCANEGRFIVSDCCGNGKNIYYITVRNNQPSPLDVSFRIIMTPQEDITIIPDNPPQLSPYFNNGTDINYWIPFNATGVAPESYDYYQLLLDDNDIAYHRSWIIDIERNDSSPYQLVAFLRYGTPSGNYDGGQSDALYPQAEGCYDWQYSCWLPRFDSRCIWLLPHCDLQVGYWYLTIWNPSFITEGIPTNLPDYHLSTFIEDPPSSLSLNSTIDVVSTPILGILTHYYLNVTALDLGYDLLQGGSVSSSFWNRYLRIEVFNITGDIDVYLNYDDLAGPESGCVTNFDSVHCDVNTDHCYLDVLPCTYDEWGLHLLKTGVYFIGIRVNFNSTYSVTANIVEDIYTAIAPSGTETGTGHRNGTENTFWSYSFSNSEVITDGSGRILSRYYRYFVDLSNSINVTASSVGDDFDDNYYVIVNITSGSDNLANETLHLHMWRDDCTNYICDLAGANSWCAIDALELAPCSLKGGRFFFIVDNPFAMNFTLNVYLNQTTIQRLEEKQIITEIIYPYEYQEYFFEASDVGQAATLAVRVCALCGDVQAWIREDLPAGPTPDSSGATDSCAIASCEAYGDITFWNEQPTIPGFDNCCEIFLDTCIYEQRGYYIGIRGVAQVFPHPLNEHLYLPAKYNIQAIQTNINFTRTQFHCAEIIEHYSDWNILPVQYFVDVESVNPGTQVRVSLWIPPEYASEEFSSVWFTINRAVSFTDSCDREFFCSTTSSCSFIVPSCVLSKSSGGRYFIWADAPRGAEIRIERWDPYVPFIHNDLIYSSTISHAIQEDWDVPYHGNQNYYRFDLTPPSHDEEEAYYNRFFVRVYIKNVRNGSIQATLNSGYEPFSSENFGYCDYPVVYKSCEADDFFSDSCYLEIEYGDIQFLDSNIHSIPRAYFLTIQGISQNQELLAIQYDFVVQTHWVVTYLVPGEVVCGEVLGNDYDFHILKPHQVEEPQLSVLHIIVDDVPAFETLQVFVKDNRLATQLDFDQSYQVETPFTIFDSPKASFDGYYYCGYENLHLSVFGMNSFIIPFDEPIPSDDPLPPIPPPFPSQVAIPYRLQVLKETVKVKELFDDTTSYADDDDDDACVHEHDFWAFNTHPHRELHPAGSFFRVAVDSEYPTEVYINKNSIAWEPCHDSGYGSNDPLVSGTTTVNVYDFCDFAEGTYYVTVVSDGPYYIYSDIRDDVRNLTLGQTYHDVLEPGMYKSYTLEVCEDWFSADDRLVVEITDVENGGVYGWINVNAPAGVRSSSSDFGFPDSCSIDSAFAEYGSAQSGFDFLLVNSCELVGGVYHILIRAAPHPEGTPERNCQLVKYRLFPYLVDYEIDPVELVPGDSINGELLNFYTIDRIEAEYPKRVNYYSFTPFTQADGFSDSSFAVIRLKNIQGGGVILRATRDHLAVPVFGYISGEINALTKESLLSPSWKIQSGRRPFTYQQILDIRFSDHFISEPAVPFCDGCTGFCVTTDQDSSDEYRRDTSVALFIPPCYLTSTIYFSVEVFEQFSEDHNITYDLSVKQHADYTLLQPDVAHSGRFSNDNWDYDLYYSVSSEPESMRWRVVVNEASEGVLLTVRNHKCPAQATWEKSMWCDADYFDRPWTCEIEIPSRAAHPGEFNLGYYVWVYGKNATYEIDFWRGRENCHEFSGTGRADGLDFCAGLIPYATWRWDQYDTLDNEARCLFEQLFDHFKTQPCWNGVSKECNSTLQQFACYESFHACDRYGFATGTCKDACDAVVYECLNTFEAVDLEYYNCTSSRYLDSSYETCSGNPDSDFATSTWNGAQFFGADPNLLLFKSTPSDYEFDYSSASSVSVSLALIAVLLLFLM
jgi:hypothetical protein